MWQNAPVQFWAKTSNMPNWVNTKTPKTMKEANVYDGGLCICGHSAMAHHTAAHFETGYWQCWRGKWVHKKQETPKFLLTVLPCNAHKFHQSMGENKNVRS